MERSIAALVAQGLKDLNSAYAFGVPGQAIMPAYNAFYDFGHPRCILSTHETAAVFSALSWATLTGAPGVVMGTTGPGVSNMATGLATAYSESLPIFAFTGEVPMRQFAKRAYQESTGHGRCIDSVALLSSVCKRSARVTSGEHFSELLATWVPVACNGRPGPIHFSVPSDIWSTTLEEGRFNECLLSMTAPRAPVLPSIQDVKRVAELLQSAKRPMLLTGRGLVAGNAANAVCECVRRWRLPWATTVRGKGAAPRLLDFSLGHIGPAQRRETLDAISQWNPDLMICVGTSLGAMALGGLAGRIPNPPPIVQVNLDIEERGAFWKADHFILSDADAFLFALAECAPIPAPERRLPSVENAPYTGVRGETPEGLHPGDVMDVVIKHIPADAIVMPDSGSHWLWAVHKLENVSANGILPGRVFGAMGQATAGAIGASLARPDQQIVAISGDGSFLMHGSEAVIAAAVDASILWVLFNDSALGRIRTAQNQDFGGRVHATEFSPVDFSLVARGLGIWARKVDNLQDLHEALRTAFALKKPALIDVRIDREVGIP